MCNENCINPLDDKQYCGAKVDCQGDNAGQACTNGRNCINGVCECPDGQIICNDKCIDPLKDAQHCGAKGTCIGTDAKNANYQGLVCKDGQECVQGLACTCPQGLVLCNNICINPLSDAQHCGAKGKCNENTPSTSDYQGEVCPEETHSCEAGKCMRVACAPEGGQLCPDANALDGGFSCINLNETDADNCGACSFKCNTLKMRYTYSSNCVGGKCQFTCHTDTTNCGTPEEPVCLSPKDFIENSEHCGACGVRCPENHYCAVKNGCVGTACCVESPCGDNSCKLNNCINKESLCGHSCKNCTTIVGAVETSCNEGSCKVSACTSGMHIAATGDACVFNSTEACAVSGSSEAVSCLRVGAKAAYCSPEGECVVTACDEGLALYLDPVKPSNSRCYEKNCCEGKHALDGKCVGGVCAFSTCLPGFHQVRNAETGNAVECVANSDRACLPAAVPNANAIDCYTLQYDLNNKIITPAALGTEYIQCNALGYCQVKNCPKDHHVEFKEFGVVAMQACVPNTDEKCAATNSGVVENCTQLNVTTGAVHSCIDGVCTKGAAACGAGYSDVDGRCIKDCCKESAGVAIGACDSTGQKCVASRCKLGFHIEADSKLCVANTKDACAAPSSEAALDCDGDNSTIAAAACNVDGQCVVGACNAGYHIAPDQKSCVLNSDTACGLSNNNVAIDCTSYSVAGAGKCSPNHFCESDIGNNKRFCNGVELQCSAASEQCAIESGALVCK